MKLVLIHGAPATGKLTVARALGAWAALPVVDNHAAIDMARMVFGFAAPGFWDLVHDLRVTTLRGAARAGVARLVTTAAYSHPLDAPFLADYAAALAPYGGALEPVHLSCSDAERARRVTAPDRAARGKIATPEGLAAYDARNNFAPIPQDTCLRLSTEDAAPADIAAAIAKHFSISSAGPDA